MDDIEFSIAAQGWTDEHYRAALTRRASFRAAEQAGTIAARSLTFDALRDATFPARPALLSFDAEGILRAGSIGEVVASRGMGKSLFVTGLGLAVASGGRFLRWQAPQPRRVLIVDGEMPSPAIQARTLMLAGEVGIESCPNLSFVAADWQDDYLPRLDTVDGQGLIEPLLDRVQLVILDNASCLFDPASESDPEAWAPAQAWLLSLRRRGIATLLVHHANRQGGARGHSKREDVMDLILKLSRPEDYRQEQGARFVVSFDKNRGFYGDAAAPFVASLDAGRWVVEGQPEGRDSRLRDDVMAFVRANPAVTKGRIAANVRGREQRIRTLVDDLAAEGLLTKDDGAYRAA